MKSNTKSANSYIFNSTCEFNPLTVNPDNIPDELKKLPHWTTWKLVWDNKDPTKKPKKVPVDLRTGEFLKVSEPDDWVSFDEALNAYQKNQEYDGIGTLLTSNDQVVVIDIDDTETNEKNGEIANYIIEKAKSYTEASPSGNGIHIFCKLGDKPPILIGNRKGCVEIYSEKRFITVTGVTNGKQRKIRACPQTLKKIHNKFIVQKQKTRTLKEQYKHLKASTDSAISKGDNSPSGQDFALCCKLLKEGHDHDEVKRLLVELGANHHKYKRQDYVDRTVEAAFEKVSGNSKQNVTQKDTGEKSTNNCLVTEDWKSKPSIDHLKIAHKPIPDPEWLIDGWLRYDTYVGQIVGEQQTGKSYLIALVCYCLACGRSYGPFNIPKPRRVVYLNVEDPEDQVGFRCKQIMMELNFSEEEQALIHENLLIFPWIGQFSTINHKAGNNNEVRMLEQIITDFKPDLVIGDTKSRLSSGDENSNSVQAELVRILESLAVKYHGPLLMAHHPTKSNPTSSRGGGAWESNVRLSINLIKMDKNTGGMFGFEKKEAHDRAFIISSNDNYGGQNNAYFYKNPETGIPQPIEPESNSLELVQNWILNGLNEHGDINKRNLLQLRAKDDSIVEKMLESFPGIIGDKKEIIASAIDDLMGKKQITGTKKGRSKILNLVLECKK